MTLLSDTPTPPESPPTISTTKFVVGWLIIIALLTLIFGNWERKQLNPNTAPTVNVTIDGTSEVVLQRNRYGHYVSNGTINNQPVTFLLDTGATYVAIPENIASRLGLYKNGRGFANTANGVTEVFNTRIEQLQIGNIMVKDVRATINPGMNHDNQILLGMSVLKDIEFTQRGDSLTLRQVN